MNPYEQRLSDLAGGRPDVVVMTAENRAAIRGLPARLGDRFIDVGICEQTLVGVAAGMALRGRVPFVHALAAFLTMRAFEFIRTDVGIPSLPVKLIGFIPGFLSDANGPTHQAVEDIALMRSIPNMCVFCPADEDELVRALPSIADDPRPFYVRFNSRRRFVEHQSDPKAGRAEALFSGRDLTFAVAGFLLEHVLEARDLLVGAGYSVGVINTRFVEPLDTATVIRAARETRTIVTVEDHFRRGGLYETVAEAVRSAGSSTPVRPLALEQRWFRTGTLADVLEAEGFTGKQIAERALHLAKGGEPS